MNERELLQEVASYAAQLVALGPILQSPTIKDCHDGLVKALAELHKAEIRGDTATVKTKLCEKCGAEFFFARLPTFRWMPLEVDAVDAKDVIPSWRYVPDFSGNPITVDPWPTMDHGEVYVDHRQTCGAGDGPRHHCVAYSRRFKANVERFEGKVGEVADQLAALHKRLNPEH